MARKDALLRLHERLVVKRNALREKFEEDLSQYGRRTDGGNDSGDAAHEGSHNELESQLVSLESRELRQIEKAISLIREGRYGTCEICGKQIPVKRLNALPFTMTCVECASLQEASGDAAGSDDADWANALEYEGRLSDKELTLGDIDIDA